MIWAGRRDHLVGDMNPLAGMPSSLVEEARGSLDRKCDAEENRGEEAE